MSDFMSVARKVLSIIEECSVRDMYSIGQIHENGGPTTDADLRVDEHLRMQLPSVFDAAYLSEEFNYPGRLDAGWHWIVDPIDGTENLIAGSPSIATSVALVDPSGECIVGIVCAPFLSECYFAVKGFGAFLNDRRLTPVSGTRRPVVSLAFPCRGPTVSNRIGAQVTSLLQQSWTIRASGSAALDICSVARARWAAFYEESTFVWDIAAASCIAREAGCSLSLSASKLKIADPHVVACLVSVNHETQEVLEDLFH